MAVKNYNPDSLYEIEGAQSRSEFIERAIRFYSGFVTAENYRDYFPEIVVKVYEGFYFVNLKHQQKFLLYIDEHLLILHLFFYNWL